MKRYVEIAEISCPSGCSEHPQRGQLCLISAFVRCCYPVLIAGQKQGGIVPGRRTSRHPIYVVVREVQTYLLLRKSMTGRRIHDGENDP
jgi:hypothetical protein